VIIAGQPIAYRRELIAMLGGGAFDPLDERAFVRWAWTHGLVGLVDRAIVNGQWKPAARARAAVRSLRASRALHATVMRRELGPAAALLTEAAGVTPIILKGPAVGERLYGAPGLRAYGDLDLMVPRSSLRRAVSALRDAGWAPVRAGRTYAALGEPLPGFAEDYGHHHRLCRRSGPAQVDLEVHWRLSDDPLSESLDHARLSARAVTIPQLGDRVVAPAPVDELLVLAIHVMNHGRATRLIWHVDLALASEALPQSDWGEAFTKANHLGLGWVLHRALDRVAETTGVARTRPQPCPPAPPWGPIRAADALPGRLAEHIGRAAPLSWRGRGRYLRRIASATGRRVLARRG
jgi:putative nucleotidyltransferase-like protein